MAKLRKKFNTKGFSYNVENQEASPGDYLYKSGVLTKDFKKIKFDSELEFSFFKNDVIHSNKGFENKSIAYNDNHTILFEPKIVCPTIRLESKYVSNNSLTSVDFYNKSLVLSTPNIPNFYRHVNDNNEQVGIIKFESIEVDQPSSIYDKMLKPNYSSSENNIFDENDNVLTVENNDIVTHENYNTVTIDYNLHKSPRPDLYLSFSKGENTRQVDFPDGTSYFTFNGNTAYFYNDEYTTDSFGPFDYLGNVGSNYKSTISNFINNSPICFSSISTFDKSLIFSNPENLNIKQDIIDSQWASIPIDTFGFPYHKKYDAAPRHLIPASKYITKPFVIEKICLEFTMSNWSITQINPSSEIMPCINFVNFFVLNQRGKINTQSLDDSRRVVYYDDDNEVLTSGVVNNILDTGITTYSSNNRSSNGLYTEQEINDMALDGQVLGDSVHSSNYVKKDRILNVDDQELLNTKSQQKDLITTISIANYSYNTNPDEDLINVDKIKQVVDYFIDHSQKDKIGSASSECIYLDKNFKITSPVKHFYKNKNLPYFSNFKIYPEKPDSTRTNIDVNSRRSISGEGSSNKDTNVIVNDFYDNVVKINDVDFEESKYILHPSDNLVLGVSLSNGFYNSNDFNIVPGNSFGDDLVKISCSEDYPLKLHLIGYYLEDENKKVIVNKTTKQYKNTKRVGYYQNEVVDQIGSNYAYLDQNYYDRTTEGIQGQFITKEIKSSKNKTELGNKFEIPNLNAGLYTDASFNAMSITYNNLSFKTDYYKLLSSDSAVYVLKHYFDKYKFGMFSNKLNHNRIHQFIDSKYKNIKKRFMKGFYKQKSPGTVKGKISLDFTGVHEYTGKNFLFEKIFSDIKSHTWSKDNGVTNITHELVALEAKFTDENNKKIKFIFQIPIFQGIEDEKLIYTLGGLGTPSSEYIDDVFVYTKTLDQFYSEVFFNLNYNTTIPVADYGQSNRILNIVNALVAEMVDGGFKPGFALAEINIIPTINQNSQKEFVDIDFEIANKGKINNASLQAGKAGANVSYENFKLEEGDLLNSYNTTSSALYSDSDIIFKDM